VISLCRGEMSWPPRRVHVRRSSTLRTVPEDQSACCMPGEERLAVTRGARRQAEGRPPRGHFALVLWRSWNAAWNAHWHRRKTHRSFGTVVSVLRERETGLEPATACLGSISIRALWQLLRFSRTHAVFSLPIAERKNASYRVVDGWLLLRAHSPPGAGMRYRARPPQAVVL
jgi:hypothetical protein